MFLRDLAYEVLRQQCDGLCNEEDGCHCLFVDDTFCQHPENFNPDKCQASYLVNNAHTSIPPENWSSFEVCSICGEQIKHKGVFDCCGDLVCLVCGREYVEG
jgi:hypothetical protein